MNSLDIYKSLDMLDADLKSALASGTEVNTAPFRKWFNELYFSAQTHMGTPVPIQIAEKANEETTIEELKTRCSKLRLWVEGS